MRINPMRTAFIAVLCVLAAAFGCRAEDRVTILYDAFSDSRTITKDWGFSALVEHDGKRILFDSGNNADIFEHNVRALGVDLTKIDFVVMSHRHTDHTSGLKYLLKVNPTVTVYVPANGANGFGGTPLPADYFRPETGLPAKMRYFDGVYPTGVKSGKLYDTGNFVLVDKLTEVSPGIFLVFTVSQKKGFLEMPELTLAIKKPNGLLLVDGCSHSGIEEILQAASAVDSRTYIVFGGLHLVATPEPEIDQLVANLKAKWKVQKLAPGHCTGEPAFARLQKAFGENYLYAGAGTVIAVE
jgi:7,8-dihydropterin-6-yl-methyl-4-(beta-D-ribofuranosyl)aminobenzene 5'-phosphate synthase